MKNDKPIIFLILKIIAPIMLLIGITLIVLGVTTGDFGPNVKMFIPGILLTAFSIPCFIIGFIPEISRAEIKMIKHLQQENKEDLTDIANTRAEIKSEAISNVASSVKKGFKDTKFCKHCGKKIDSDAKFCSECGEKQ